MNERMNFDAARRTRRPGDPRSPFLQQQGAAIAALSLERARARLPELAERLGAGAGPLNFEDQRGTLASLDAALCVGDPARFLHHADWLVRVLRPRGVGPEAIATLFGTLAEVMQEAPCPPDLQAHRSVLVGTLREAAHRVGAEAAPRLAAF